MAGNSGDTQGNGGWRRGVTDSGSSWAEKERANEKKNLSFSEKERAKEKGGFYRGWHSASNAASDAAAAAFRNAEDNSVGNEDAEGGIKDDGLLGVESSEREAGGLYNGIGKEKEDKKKGKGKGKGFLRRKGPMALILGLILGVGGMSFFGVSTELVAWKENLYSMFGQNSAIINRRSNYIMRRLLKGGSDSNVSTNIFGNAKFKISTKLSKKLSAQGINYIEVDDVDGKPLKMLVFEDADGRYIPIVASDDDVPRANALANALAAAGDDIDIGGGNKAKLATDSGITLSNAKKTNKNFNTKYGDATSSFTSKLAGWFDNVVDSLLERIIGRNARNQTDIDDPDEESVNKLLLGNASEGVDDNEIKAVKQAVDDEGKPIDDTYTNVDGSEVVDGETIRDIESGNGKVKTADSPDVPAVKASLTAKAKKVAMMSSTVGCAVMRAMGAISAAIGAVQTINVIQYASKYLEMADKIKAGDADETVNIAANNLNQPRSVDLRDIDGEEVSVEGSVTEGNGWNQVFSSTNLIDENDPSALLVNREYTNKSALRAAIGNNAFSDVLGAIGDFGASVEAFRACNGIQLVTGVISFVSDVFALFTFGASKFVKDFIKGAIDGAKLAAAMGVIGVVVSLITPTVARWFASLLGDAFLGKTGGYALLSGAQNIMNSNLQMSTGRYADNENAIEVFALTRDVEEEWAEYERNTRSPFDVTSKYTFFGSIYNSILPILNKSGGMIMSTASSVASLMGSSILALMGTSVSAAGETTAFANSLASEGNCGYLNSVGVAGDFACNKYAGAYVGEIETEDPEVIYSRMASYGSFEGEDVDGNPKVKLDSDYAKYIIACVSSDTQPGTMSGTVQGFLTGIGSDINNASAAAGGLVNFGRNFIPGEGLLDAFESLEDFNNAKWNSGRACTGNTGDRDFDQMVKDFSMYNLDQRALYLMGVTESNSTVGFLEEYYKENPLDYTFEGQIARVSGMTKEEVEDTLALIDYYNYIAQYDASERYAFGAPVVEKDNTIMFDNENVMASEYVLVYDIAYADVRNRVNLV